MAIRDRIQTLSVQGRLSASYDHSRPWCVDVTCAAPVAQEGDRCERHGCFFCARDVPHKHIERPRRVAV